MTNRRTDCGSVSEPEDESVLKKASEYEADRGFVLPHHDDARLLLYAIQDKPHRAIKYISELIESHREEAGGGTEQESVSEGGER